MSYSKRRRPSNSKSSRKAKQSVTENIKILKDAGDTKEAKATETKIKKVLDALEEMRNATDCLRNLKDFNSFR